MLANKKMKVYLDRRSRLSSINLERLAFENIGDGFFFERSVSPNLKLVADTYAQDSGFDWPGLEYTTNKIHLEDEIQAAIPDVAFLGVDLARRLADQFKIQFPDRNAIFYVGCDEFGEYPSVTLSFYVKRDGMLPLLPEDETSLDAFDNAVLILG
jgi:hypothetical protein